MILKTLLEIGQFLFYGAGILILSLNIVLKLYPSRTYRLRTRNKLDFDSIAKKFTDKQLETESGKTLDNRLRRAGYPFKLDVFYYRAGYWTYTFIVVVLGLAKVYSEYTVANNIMKTSFVMTTLVCLGFLFVPRLVLASMGRSRADEVVSDLLRLIDRLTICVNEKTDLRDALVMASRTCKVLIPYVQEFAVRWNINQEEAIRKLCYDMGVRQAFSFRNTLLSLRNANKDSIQTVLDSQLRHLKTTLDSDVKKRIESMPMGLVLLTMVPFGSCIIILLYPWLCYIVEMTSTSLGM